MGLFKSFFPCLAGTLDASLGDHYGPPVGAFWSLSEQAALDKALYHACFRPRGASFVVQSERTEH